MPEFWSATIGGLLGSSVAAAILGTAFLRINKTIEGRVKSKFDEAMKIFESKRVWKQEALSELFGPLQMQFERTKRAGAGSMNVDKMRGYCAYYPRELSDDGYS